MNRCESVEREGSERFMKEVWFVKFVRDSKIILTYNNYSKSMEQEVEEECHARARSCNAQGFYCSKGED
jgi:hypothetical protein